MRILALDLSTHAGWAVLETEQPIPVSVAECGEKIKLIEYGTISLDGPALEYGTGKYPWNYYAAVCDIAGQVSTVMRKVQANKIVIEATNLGKQRFSQEILEWIHFGVLRSYCGSLNDLVYLSTSSWRKTLNIRLSASDKKANSKLSRAKSKAKATGGKLDKKTLGIKGRRDWKHLSVEFVNINFGTSFIMKDNNTTDAICLATAYLCGATVCDGIGNFN